MYIVNVNKYKSAICAHVSPQPEPITYTYMFSLSVETCLSVVVAFRVPGFQGAMAVNHSNWIFDSWIMIMSYFNVEF